MPLLPHTESAPTAAEPDADAALERIAATAAALRGALMPLLEQLAGTPPRPVRLTRGLGLDKSQASRLVQAARSDGDAQFLHAVPSPTGLRILIERATPQADAALLTAFAQAVERFDHLLATLPGGRQALDALLGAGSASIRERREQMARQASFKAVSFLFGHYCETLTTALFLAPSAKAGMLDMVEVHRRIGLQRVAPGATLPLLSLQVQHGRRSSGKRAVMADLEGREGAHAPADFLLHDAGVEPPQVEIHEEAGVATFVIGGEAGRFPARISTGYRVLRFDDIEHGDAYKIVRNYMLHLPCRTLVRDVFIADGVWPDARPLIDFYLPGPTGTPKVDIEPGKPHLRRLNLTARIEQLPAGAAALELDGVADQRALLEQALARAGLDIANFRGWRCRMAYPVPLVEMHVALRFAGR